MSVPCKDTTWGDIIFEGKMYRIFSVPLNEENRKKISKYKQKSGWITFSPWLDNNYLWRIKNDKLYLQEVKLFGFKGSQITNIFGVKELFASWQNKDIEVLVSKESFDVAGQRRMKLVKMKIKVLRFENGKLISVEDTIKEIKMRKSLVEIGLVLE